MSLLCAVCLMTEDDPESADTIVQGTAVCADHLSLVSDLVLSTAVRGVYWQARKEKRARR